MTTEADKMAVAEAKVTTVETKLDGFIEETRGRFDDMNIRISDQNARMNVQFQATIAMWVTTMMAVLGTLAVILVKL